MNKLEWIRNYRVQTGCGASEAVHAWEQTRACMAGEGINLRDAAALAALPAIVDVYRHGLLKPGETREHMFARRAFEIADAFVAARETKEDDR